MNTETIKKSVASEAKAMRAYYFDSKADPIGPAAVQWAAGTHGVPEVEQGEESFPVAGVGEAKALGRTLHARGFRIWLGKEAEEADGPSQLFYVQPWPGARYQKVNREGFFATFEGIVKRQERRARIQFMRQLTDPAAPKPKEEVNESGGE